MKYILSIILIVFLSGAISCGGGNGNKRQVISGRIMAIAEKDGNDQKIKVGGGPGAVPAGSTVNVTNLSTMETKSIVATNDGSFDPEFQGNTNDLFKVQIIQNGELSDEFTLGVTLLTDIINKNLGSLGDTPSELEIKNNIAYVLNGFSDNIQRFDLSKTPPQELSPVAVPTGSDPVSFDLLDNGKIYTANLIGQSVSLINPDTNECEIIYVKENPSVNTGCDQTVVIDGAFEDPSDVQLVGSKLYVTNNNFDEFFFPKGNGFITVIDTDTNQLDTIIESDGANSGSINLIDNDMFVLNTGNFVFDPDTNKFQCDTDFPPSVSIIDTGTETIKDTIEIPLSTQNPLVCAPGIMAITLDKKYAFLGLGLVGGMLKIDIENRSVINGTSNPVAFTDLSGLNSVTDIDFNDQGFGFAALFNTDQIAVFKTDNNELNPFPFISPLPAGIKATNPDSDFFDGVQFIDLRNGDFSGPDLYFITTLSSKLGSANTGLLTQ